MCNGSKKNFGPFKKLFGLAKSSNFKERVQWSKIFSALLLKYQS